MPASQKVNFQFKNHVSPRYIQPLLLQLEYGEWYESIELRNVLRANGLNVDGKDIIQANITFWAKIGLGEVRREAHRGPNLFRLTLLGKQVSGWYSTNQPLFFDIIHFLLYSAWYRSQQMQQVPFWLYQQVCDWLWEEVPSRIDSYALTNHLHEESRRAFPEYDPKFPERSVRAVFPWLGALTPPFLSRCGSKSDLCLERRSYCTPQLFHLAADLVYASQRLNYGTSLAIDEQHIADICRVCLLDPAKFWDMASLTAISIREMELRKGQWATSLALASAPQWIQLPDFATQIVYDEEQEE
jgi:hypothetical protein